jgi:tetratricopeptide (TPR) repeat protein
MISDMRQTLTTLAATSCAIVLSACVHTPPGTSVEVALAKRPELVSLPPPVAPPTAAAFGPGPGHHVYLPAVEPLLPVSDLHERVTEATSRADFLLETGNEPEAIAAYEEAVQIDPSQGAVWRTLAELYEKSGDAKKAAGALTRSKKIARH